MLQESCMFIYARMDVRRQQGWRKQAPSPVKAKANDKLQAVVQLISGEQRVSELVEARQDYCQVTSLLFTCLKRGWPRRARVGLEQAQAMPARCTGTNMQY